MPDGVRFNALGFPAAGELDRCCPPGSSAIYVADVDGRVYCASSAGPVLARCGDMALKRRSAPTTTRPPTLLAPVISLAGSVTRLARAARAARPAPTTTTTTTRSPSTPVPITPPTPRPSEQPAGPSVPAAAIPQNEPVQGSPIVAGAPSGGTMLTSRRFSFVGGSGPSMPTLGGGGGGFSFPTSWGDVGSALGDAALDFVGAGDCPGIGSVKIGNRCVNLGDVLPGGDPAVTGTVPSVGGNGNVSAGGKTYGAPVAGFYGVGIVPRVEARQVMVCPPGHKLGKDGVCYRHLAKGNRKWNPGTKPLLTGGEVNAIRRAARAGRKLKGARKDLAAAGRALTPPTSSCRAKKKR